MNLTSRGRRTLPLIACMFLAVVGVLGAFAAPASAAQVTLIGPDGLTLATPYQTTHWNDVWDLTQGDLTLSYTIDMNNVLQPGTWNTYNGTTLYAEVGLRGEGAADFNPGPFGVYQGGCGGWMVHDCDTWNDSDGYTEHGAPKDSTQDLDDKFGLQASGGRGERDYDVLGSDWGAVLNPTIGSYDNVGIWWDRDGVDPYQSTKYADTGGIYSIVLVFHAISADLGVVFATINGEPQGFYAAPANWDGTPEYYPAGLSFKGDMKHMQVFAGVWGPNSDAWAIGQYGLTYFDYGSVTLSNMIVDGVLGTSDPLVADFTYAPSPALVGSPVQFTDASHGGMPPYTYKWDFDNNGVVDSTDQNPSHTYAAAGTYTVKLTVTPYRCTPKTVTKQITVEEPVVDLAVAKSGPVWLPLGGAITYTYEVTNPGNVSVAPTLVDDLGTPLDPSDDVNPTYVSGDDGNGLVDPGETWVYTFTYTPAKGTGPYNTFFNNVLTNTATVIPVDVQDSDLSNNSDSYTLAMWTLRKDVLLYFQGHNVNYSDPNTEFTVEIYKLNADGVTKDLLGTFTIKESDPAELWLSEGQYYFKEISVPAGYTPARDWWWLAEPGSNWRDMSFENLIRFDLAIEKTGPATAAPGETITYHYKVTNTGPAAVTPVLSDDKAGTPIYDSGDTNLDGKIQSTETWLYHATYTVPADAAGTSIVNVVTVKDAADDYGTGWKLGGDTNLSNNTATWTVLVTVPSTVTQIQLVKKACPDSVPEFSGALVIYTFKVTNTGTVPVTLTKISDDVYGVIYARGPRSMPIVLAPGASKTFVKMVCYNKDVGAYANVATATAVDSSGRVVTATDDATVTVTDVLPKVCVTKRASVTSVPYTGGRVTYTITVRNGGGEPITLTKVVDDKLGVIYEGAPITLAAGAGKTFTAKGWVSGPKGTCHVNTVTATASDNEGNAVSATATAKVLLSSCK